MRRIILLLTVLTFVFCTSSSQAQTRLYGASSVGYYPTSQDTIVFYHYDPGDSVPTKDFRLPRFYGDNPTGGPLFVDGIMYGLSENGGHGEVGGLWSYKDNRDPKIKELHAFGEDSDGHPIGTPVHKDGMIYGVTRKSSGVNSTVFSYDIGSDAHNVAWDFTAVSGYAQEPRGGLLLDSNKLWGLAAQWSSFGYDGQIYYYDIDNDTLVTVYHNGSSSGVFQRPIGELVKYNGKFYGITEEGGDYDDGILFFYDPQLDSLGVLLHLNASTIGGNPQAGLTLKNGQVYWHNKGGAYNFGTLLRYNLNTNALTKLRDFDGSNDGAYPYSKPFVDGGFVYGVTSIKYGSSNGGTVYKLNISTYGYEVLEVLKIWEGRPQMNEFTKHDGKLYFFCSNTADVGSYYTQSGSAFRVDLASADFEHMFLMRDFPFGYPRGRQTYVNGSLYGWGSGGRFEDGMVYRYTPSTDYYEVLALPDVGGFDLQSLSAEHYNGSIYFNLADFGTSAHRLMRYDIAGDSLEVLQNNSPYGMTDIEVFGNTLLAIRSDYSYSGRVSKIDLDDPAYGTSILHNVGGVNGSYMSYELRFIESTYFAVARNGGASGTGTLFSYDTLSSTFTKLYDFSNSLLGLNPFGDIAIQDSVIYGECQNGGTYNEGSLWAFNLVDSSFAKLADMDGTNSGYSQGLGVNLIDSIVYGTTQDINSIGPGVIYRFRLSDSTWLPRVNMDSAAFGEPMWLPIQAKLPMLLSANTITVYLDSFGQASTTIGDVNNGSTSLNDSLVLWLSDSLFDCSDLPQTHIWLYGDDQHGHTDSLLVTVNVLDTMAPIQLVTFDTIFLNLQGQYDLDSATLFSAFEDNCSLVSVSISPNSFDCGDVGGLVSYALTAVDDQGNVFSDSASLAVIDTFAPISNLLFYYAFVNAQGMAVLNPNELVEEMWDSCGIDSISIVPDSFDCNMSNEFAGLIMVDVNGNISIDSVEIIVLDTLPPLAVFPTYYAGLDAAGEVSVDPGVVLQNSTDNCQISWYLLDSINFTCADIGNNQVQGVVVDASGNADTIAGIIHVEDNIDPTPIGHDTTLYLDANGNVSITAIELDAGSFDNCGIAQFSLSPSSFDCADVGANTATLTAIDVDGNGAPTNVTITVLDTFTPVITLCEDQMGCSGTPLDYALPEADDNCIPSLEWVSGPALNESVAAGNYTVAYRAVDAGGNADTCSFVLTVIQTVLPDLGNDTTVMQGDTLELSVAGGFASVVWSTGESGPSIQVIPTSPLTQYIVTTIDQNGCEASDTITIGTMATGLNTTTNSSWKIYPNPAVNQLTFHAYRVNQPYRIVSMDGRTLSTGKANRLVHPIDISSLSSGVYAFVSEDRTVSFVVR
ncbi:MAG: T9SS type A sorting domain-containing protein [Cyclobacteriaceae bacterium]